MNDLFDRDAIVIAETYPGEIYQALKLNFPSKTELNRRFPGQAPIQKSGKRSQAARRWNAASMLDWSKSAFVRLDPQLEALIRVGFGPGPSGEDPFDATVGLFGMLNVVLGFQPEWGQSLEEEGSKAIWNVEGWILGQVEKPAPYRGDS